MFDGKTDVSLNKASKAFRVDWHTIKKWLKEMKIKRKARKKIPWSNKKQQDKQRIILYKIARQEFKATNDRIDVVMDDETYIDMNECDSISNKYYYDSGKKEVKNDIKYRAKTKFSQKVLIWLAISRRGLESMFGIKERVN